MKNSQGSSLSNAAMTVGILVALSGHAGANEQMENASPLLAPTEGLTTQVQSNVAGMLSSSTKDYHGVRYDTTINTLIIGALNNAQEKGELANQENLKKKIEFYEQRDIETFFLFDLDIFNAIYEGDLSVLDTFPEIATLLEKRDSLLEEKAKASTEESSKTIDKNLLSVSKEITKMKEYLSVKYMQDVTKKIKELLPTYEQKVTYVERINTENENFANFVTFFQSILQNETTISIQTPLYKDTAYLPEISLRGLVTKTSQVDREAYTPEQKTSYVNSFISLKDVHNITLLSKSINESNVLDYLADLDNDGKVSDKDIGIFSGKQLSTLLHETETQMTVDGKGKVFYNNLSYIFGLVGMKTVLNNRTDLVALLQVNPLAKLRFNDAFNRLNISGSDVGYVLRYGSEGLKKWEQMKGKVLKNPLVGKLFTKIHDGTRNLGTEINRLKNEGIITNKEYALMIDDLQKTVNSAKFEEQVMSQTLSLLSGFSAMYFSSKYGGVQASYSNQAINTQFPHAMKKFIDSIKLSTGIYNTDKGNMLMAGITYEGVKQMSETSALNFGIGVNFGFGSNNNVLPVLSLGHIAQTNSEELKNAGIADFHLDEKSFRIGGSLSMINTHGSMLGIGAGWNSNRKSAIEKKAAEFSKLLDGTFACDASLPLEVCMQYIQKMITSPGYEKVLILGEGLLSTESRFRTLGFDSMNINEKRRVLEDEKMFQLMKFLNFQASSEEEKGWNVSGFGLGLSILTKMAGIPFIPGIEMSKISMNHTPDQAKKMMGEIMEQEGMGETTFLDKDDSKLGENLEKMLGIEGLKVSYEGGYLKMTSVGSNLLDFLSKNGVDIRMAVSKKITSHISYEKNTLIIGDVKRMSLFSTLTADGKKITFTIGDNKGTRRTVSFSPSFAKTLENHTPMPISGIELMREISTQQQTANLREKKFGLGIF